MYLYLISQDVNTGYDTYSDAVVAANTEAEAAKIVPGGYDYSYTWASPENVKVKLIGKAIKGTEAGVICASFHAG